MRLVRRILAAAVLAGAVTACGGLPNLPAETPGVLRGAAEVLEALASEDGPGGLLDLALGYLAKGDLEACCSALRSHLEQFGDDPRVRSVLELLESELKRGG